MVTVRLLSRTCELAEDMGEWQNVNAYSSGTFTLNKWDDNGFHARLVRLESGQSLVIATPDFYAAKAPITDALGRFLAPPQPEPPPRPSGPHLHNADAREPVRE